MSKSSLSVCALVPYPLHIAPSQRYRLEQWAPALKTQGIEMTFLPFADAHLMRVLHRPGRYATKALSMSWAIARRLGDVLKARRFDAVVVHRALCIAGPDHLESLLARFDVPVIFDFDDAIFLLHTSAANSRFGWLKFPGKTANLCRMSTHITAGNSYLADYARQFNPNITIIPSSVDTRHYKPQNQSKPRGDKLIVGWTGSSTSQTFLEMFAPTLRPFFEQHNAELYVHSDRKPEMDGIPCVWRPWKAETEIEELSQFDIGIMPLPDNQWTRGKCAMKALLYMAMGVPTVCSAVGANCELIEHGENGLLASADSDWPNCLQSLLENQGLRAQLGERGCQTVEDHYSMDVCAARFANVVRTVVDDNQRSKHPS